MKKNSKKSTNSDPTIPEYFAYQRFQQDDDHVQIIASDLTLTQDIIGSGQNILIQSDSLTINKDIVNPGKDLVINTRELIIKNDATITTSGSNPKNNYKSGDRAKDGEGHDKHGNGKSGSVGKDGSTGCTAGAISISTETQQGKIKLIANGGNGGRGQYGGNGVDGKNGSSGHDAKIRKEASNDKVTSHAKSGGNGGDGGNSGGAGSSGDSGNGGTITFSVTDSKPLLDKDSSVKGGSAIDAGKPGTPGKHGKGGRGGKKAKCTNYNAGGYCITVCELTHHRAKSGKNGKDGKIGENHACKGTEGKDGSINKITGDKALQHTIDSSSIDQRQLSFHLAKLNYLSQHYTNSKEIFQWLYKVCEIDSTHPLAEYNEDQTGWEQLKNQAQIEISRLSTGLNFYGCPENHAPLVAFNYYSQALDTMLELGSEIELMFLQYQKSDDDAKAQQKSLNNALTQVDKLLDNLNNQHDQVIKDITNVQNDIAVYGKQIAAQRQVLENSEDKFKNAVQNNFKCSFSDVLSATTSILQMGISAWTSMKNIGSIFSEISKETLKFDNVIENIETVTDDISDLQDKWNTIKGSITTDNPDAGKIVMKKEDFDSMMDKFIKDYPEAKSTKKQGDIYMNLIQARNQCVLKYNSLVIHRKDIESQIAANKNQKSIVINAIAENKKPSASPMRNLVQNIYSRSKEHILMYLYQEHLAYNYWALGSKSFDVADNTIAELSDYHVQLKQDVIDQMNDSKYSGPRQEFNDIVVELNSDDLKSNFDQFTQTGKLTFEIPMDFEGFSGFAQIIATNFKIQVHGIKASDDRVYVKLKHNGMAQFLNTAGEYFLFSHDPQHVFYAYAPSSGKVIAGGDLGGNGDEYVGLSPFTSWSLEIPTDPKFNKDIDFSEVTGITISFSGSCLGLTTSKRKKNTKKQDATF